MTSIDTRPAPAVVPASPNERIYVTRQETDQIEREINLRRHVERYAITRQFLSGRVLDAACGVGYGAYLCQKNPDVTEIVGIDCDHSAIDWANANFGCPRAQFVHTDIASFREASSFQTLLSLETVEHLPDPRILNDLVERHDICEVVISFPLKKTTHYNPHHVWDFYPDDILRIFPEFQRVSEINQNHDYMIQYLVRRNRRTSAAQTFDR